MANSTQELTTCFPRKKQSKYTYLPLQKPAALFLPGCVAPSLHGNEPPLSFCSLHFALCFLINNAKNETRGKVKSRDKGDARYRELMEQKDAEKPNGRAVLFH